MSLVDPSGFMTDCASDPYTVVVCAPAYSYPSALPGWSTGSWDSGLVNLLVPLSPSYSDETLETVEVA